MGSWCCVQQVKVWGKCPIYGQTRSAGLSVLRWKKTTGGRGRWVWQPFHSYVGVCSVTTVTIRRALSDFLHSRPFVASFSLSSPIESQQQQQQLRVLPGEPADIPWQQQQRSRCESKATTWKFCLRFLFSRSAIVTVPLLSLALPPTLISQPSFFFYVPHPHPCVVCRSQFAHTLCQRCVVPAEQIHFKGYLHTNIKGEYKI